MRLYAVLHLTAVTGHGAGEWRQTIAEIWRDFKGLVSYNTDKYQKHNVAWWDCVQNMCHALWSWAAGLYWGGKK